MNESEHTVGFSHVIVGVDGRQGGRDAIALARLLVAPRGRLTLAHIRAGGPVPADVAGDAREATSEPPELAQSQRLLECERKAADVTAELRGLAAASVGRGLHQLSEREGADLLTVGSCHRGLLSRVLVGDDTRASLNGAACAVAIAPLAYERDLGGLKTIGVGYDGSEESTAAVLRARELASRYGATVRVLQVARMPASAAGAFNGVAWGNAAEDALNASKRDVTALEGVDGDAVLGLAGEELAAFAKGLDLLVVGSRSYGPLRRLMFGSTSHYLARHVGCPLLILPRIAGAESTPRGVGDQREEVAISAQTGVGNESGRERPSPRISLVT
jgi:nucleotide-binding universal stress UspA family protein